MSYRQPFIRVFFSAVAVQFIIWIFYFLFGIDSHGGEPTFQKIILWVYRPVIFVVESMQVVLGMRTWAGLGFIIVFGPLIGAMVYSAVLAFVIVILRRGSDSGGQSAT